MEHRSGHIAAARMAGRDLTKPGDLSSLRAVHSNGWLRADRQDCHGDDMVRELVRRAAPRRERRFGRAALLRWWGCSAPNQMADRACRFRRLAIGLAALPIPLVIMAGVLVADDRSTRYAIAHLVVAVGSAWLAFDLIDRASSLNRRGRPHASSVVLLIGLGLLIGVAVIDPMAGFSPPVLSAIGLSMLVVGYLALLAAERCDEPLLFMAGRWTIVAGAFLVAVIQGAQTIIGYSAAPAYAAGLGAVAFLLLAMGWSEARVLLRGAALHRVLARR